MKLADIQNRRRIPSTPEMQAAFESYVDLDRAPCEAFVIGWIAGREALEREIETRFWALADRDGLANLPSDMWEAIDALALGDRKGRR
jgi:hypothetical protein